MFMKFQGNFFRLRPGGRVDIDCILQLFGKSPDARRFQRAGACGRPIVGPQRAWIRMLTIASGTYPAFQLLFLLYGFVMVCHVLRAFCPNIGAGALAHQTR
jgi:hypothetical protein